MFQYDVTVGITRSEVICFLYLFDFSVHADLHSVDLRCGAPFLFAKQGHVVCVCRLWSRFYSGIANQFIICHIWLFGFCGSPILTSLQNSTEPAVEPPPVQGWEPRSTTLQSLHAGLESLGFLVAHWSTIDAGQGRGVRRCQKYFSLLQHSDQSSGRTGNKWK